MFNGRRRTPPAWATFDTPARLMATR